MTNSQTDREGWQMKAWWLAVGAIAAWALLFARSAEAEGFQVPDVVLAQVLGPDAVSAAPAPAAEVATTNLVANRIRQNFEDQLVAGVSRPSVELEVHFDFDSDQLHTESHDHIEAAASVLTDHFPNTRFRVAGYTDTAGDAEYNQVLSERRADAVWQALVDEYGIDPERLERVGFGEDGDGEAEDAQRRRVELQILRTVQAGA